jgi:hypothetical protein
MVTGVHYVLLRPSLLWAKSAAVGLVAIQPGHYYKVIVSRSQIKRSSFFTKLSPKLTENQEVPWWTEGLDLPHKASSPAS